jgi:hypothetical protein
MGLKIYKFYKGCELMKQLKYFPFYLSASATLIIGFVGIFRGLESSEVCKHMAYTMILMFISGVMLKQTIRSVYEEYKNDKLKKLIAQKQQSVIDVRVDDSMDEFTPLEISNAVKTKMQTEQ